MAKLDQHFGSTLSSSITLFAENKNRYKIVLVIVVLIILVILIVVVLVIHVLVVLFILVLVVLGVLVILCVLLFWKFCTLKMRFDFI